MNKMPKIYAKSALIKEQVYPRLLFNPDGLEIQLLTELVNGKLEDYLYALETFNLDDFKDCKIKAIHAPILYHYGLQDVNIETLCNANNFMLLDQTCFIANYYGKIQNEKTLVIIHSESCIRNMRLNDDNWKRVLNCMGCLLLKYPNIEITIENVIPIAEQSDGCIHLSNNFQFDNVRMVEELRKQLNTTRIGTVLDVCHAEMTIQFLNAILGPNGLYKDEPSLPKGGFSMDDFFRENKGVIKLIHMSKTINHGFGKDHAMWFEEGDKGIIKYYLDFYFKYNYSCPITLEVIETDYNKGDKFDISFKEFKKCFK